MNPVLVPLSNGMVTLVDAGDAERVLRYNWFPLIGTVTYARNRQGLLHRFILGLKDDKIQVDHINHNGLDNRRENLRIVSRSINMVNRRRFGKGQFKGAYQTGVATWKAGIRKDSKFINLGTFPTAELAARAYDRAAIELFGDFAKLNFPSPIPTRKAA